MQITNPALPPEAPSFTNNLQAALFWHAYGFSVIPVSPDTKATAVRWDGWLKGLTAARIKAYYGLYPTHELGFIVGDQYIVFDADSPESLASLYAAEEKFGVHPMLVGTTKHGEHHSFKLASGTRAKTSVHSTKDHPERVDVKTGRTMVVLPPSTDKHIATFAAKHASELSAAPQAFIDALTGLTPRPLPPGPQQVAVSQPLTPLPLLQACIDRLDPDMGRQNWFRVGAALHHETSGGADGFTLFDTWSAKGTKYKGIGDTGGVWKSIKPGHAKPSTMGTLRHVLREAGHEWYDILADLEGGTESDGGAQ